MVPSTRFPHHAQHDDLDDDDGDRTTVDLIPWHEEEDSSGVRIVPPPASVPSVPRPGLRSVPRPTPRSAPPSRAPHAAPRTTPPPPPPQPVPPARAPQRSGAVIRWSEPRPSEDVESLSLPFPLHEDLLPPGARPESEAQLRVAIVRVVRELGRDYRRGRGCVLRTDAAAVDVAQRHLMGLAAEVRAGRMDARALATEVARHGALLGEIVARRLGGEWIDVAGDHPGLWRMSVPTGTVFAPIGRVHRFLVQRNREQDLVGFFLDLDDASRRLARPPPSEGEESYAAPTR